MTDTTLGKHLLGRIPSTPDSRDYQLRNWLGTATPLEQALAAALASKKVATATKNWLQIATPLIIGGVPTPIPPTPTPPPAPLASYWADPEPILDQGNYGTCVGNGFAQFGNTLPVDDKFTEKDARKIYYEATVIDGQPDDPDAPGGGQQGSTVRSGAKAMKNRGRVGTYAFAKTIAEAIAFLPQGPLVMGSDWTGSMFTPDASGVIHPTGSVEGGHCYVLVGYDPGTGLLRFRNSWSADWGYAGDFFMSRDEYESLWASNGEACAAVELKAVATPIP